MKRRCTDDEDAQQMKTTQKRNMRKEEFSHKKMLHDGEAFMKKFRTAMKMQLRFQGPCNRHRPPMWPEHVLRQDMPF